MHLAQINVATLRAPLDDPQVADFVAGIDPINALAEEAPGFVWRYVGDDSAGGSIDAVDDPRVVENMSVWESLEALRTFSYAGAHLDFVRRRREWFERMDVFLAMWWIPVGHRPGIAEGRSRLRFLQARGSTAKAFTFSSSFEPDGTPSPPRSWPPHSPRR